MLLANLHNNIGVYHQSDLRLPQALESFGQALEAYKAAGSRNGAVTVYLNLARSEELLCRPAKARDLLLRVLQECREIGSRAMEALGHANLSSLLCELGDCQSGHDSALKGLGIAQITGDREAGNSPIA